MLLFIAAAVVILQLIAAAPHDSAAILNLSSQLPGAEQVSHQFSYTVEAPGLYHDRSETRSSDITSGRFRVALPDRRLQTVTYRASHARGFTANVTYGKTQNLQELRGTIGDAPEIGSPVVPVSNVSEQDYQEPLTHGLKRGYEVGESRSKPSRSRSQGKSASAGSHSPITSLSAFVSIASLDPLTAADDQDMLDLKARHKPLRSKQQTDKIFIDNYHDTPILKVSHEPHKTIHQTDQNYIADQNTKQGPSDEEPSYATVIKPPIGEPVEAPAVTSYKKRRLGHWRPLTKATDSLKAGTFSSTPVTSLPHFGRSTTSSDKPVYLLHHLPSQKVPPEGPQPPATQDQAFSVAGKKQRYAISKNDISSVRTRLNGIVHHI